MEIFLQNPYLIVLLTAAALSLLIHTLLFTGILSKFTKNTPINSDAQMSVVMAVKNESIIIEKSVNQWIDKLSDAAELIIADDQSWDNTPELLEKLEEIYKNLRVVYLREESVKLSGKKFALTMAIKGAKHNNLLLTDADCYPLTDVCLALYNERFDAGSSMVLGHSPIVGDAGLSGFLQKLEGLQNAIHYTGFSSLGMFYMGIGRALAYNKDKFLSLGGFKALYTLPYGDDDLFVQKFAKHFKKSILLNPKAFIYTNVIEGFIAYWNQKRRHLSAGVKYKFFHKIILSLLPLSQMLTMISFILALLFFGVNSTVGHIAIITLAAKTILEVLYYTVLGNKLAYGFIGLPLLFWQYVSPIFNGLVYVSIKFRPVKIWMK